MRMRMRMGEGKEKAQTDVDTDIYMDTFVHTRMHACIPCSLLANSSIFHCCACREDIAALLRYSNPSIHPSIHHFTSHTRIPHTHTHTCRYRCG